MKKSGFTLQEALITIGIIGIIAAITVPAITKIIPNQYQTKYLKAYNAITNLTKDMLMDSNLYWFNSDNLNCDGLSCSTVPSPGSVPLELISMITNNNQNPQPDKLQKYAAILAYNMQVPRDNIAIHVPDINPHFVTSDGIEFVVNYAGNANGPMLLTINVDMNKQPPVASEDPNWDGNTIPNMYSFLIDNDGNVTPVDRFGLLYLNDPTSTHKRSEIIQLAEDIYNNSDGQFFRPEVDDYDSTNDTLCRDGYSIFCRHATQEVINGSSSNILNSKAPQ